MHVSIFDFDSMFDLEVLLICYFFDSASGWVGGGEFKHICTKHSAVERMK